jgi:hypothetical protein
MHRSKVSDSNLTRTRSVELDLGAGRRVTRHEPRLLEHARVALPDLEADAVLGVLKLVRHAGERDSGHTKSRIEAHGRLVGCNELNSRPLVELVDQELWRRRAKPPNVSHSYTFVAPGGLCDTCKRARPVGVCQLIHDEVGAIWRAARSQSGMGAGAAKAPGARVRRRVGRTSMFV